MIIFQSVFGWISTIVSLLCLVWLFGLGVFVIVRTIILKVKAKKMMKEDLKDYKNFSRRKFGSDNDDCDDDWSD